MSFVVISNGFNKFHMSMAAAEASRRGLLSSFITGAYPTPSVRTSLRLFGLENNRKLARLLARRARIPDDLVHPLLFSEVVYVLGALAQNRGRFAVAAQTLNLTSLRHYGSQAVPHIRRAVLHGAKLYHYRAGFGYKSVQVAKECGLFALCDHSMAHPDLVEWIVQHRARLPYNGSASGIDGVLRAIRDDIDQADAVLVNSEFVKRTFCRRQFNSDRLHVIYLGVDDAFLADAYSCSHLRNKAADGPLRLMFAGLFDRWKGADSVVGAFGILGKAPVILEIAGAVTPEFRQAHPMFFRDPRVREIGLLSRAEMAEAMSRAEVFVFPSMAEGSARVVFEALACGCYIITTPNSGSIVEDGIHGRLVSPGDAEAVARAIDQALADRNLIAKIGCANARLVESQYRQHHYGEKLAKLYRTLLQ